MTRVHLTLPVCAVIATLFAASTAPAQSTGYWQYIRTESYIRPYPAGAVYPDTYIGGEGALSVTVTDTVSPGTVLGISFFWSRPPVTMISGTPIYWPVSARIDRNVANGRHMGMHFNAEMYPYDRVSNLATADPEGGSKFFALDANYTMAEGTVVTDNAALWKPPGQVPGSSAADANGLAAVLLQVQDPSSSYFLWNYVYRWVPGSIGSCGGTCTLASPGQTIGVNGGPGSVAITATSTRDVISSDSWIQITSPKNGTGNSTVTYTVSPNTDGPRNSTIIIGGQPYVISQDGTGAPISSTPTGLDLHRPKLVLTDTSGSTFTLQPAPGKNDGTDDGSPNAGKDTGVFGQSSGGWQTHNFGKDSPVYLMNSTCNDSTGYAYLQFSLASLPAQGIASAKVQVYAGSMVVSNMAANPTDPVFAARRVTSAWDESKMTRSSGQPTYDSTVVDSQTLSGVAGNKTAVNAWLTYDITNLYKGWASGTTPNYGLRFSHENGSCLNGWQGLFYTSNDQPAASTGASCSYSLSLSAASAAATGGSGAFTMNASAATCTWTASAASSWLHVVSGASGTGSGAVSYTADANTGSARQGTITLAGSGQTLSFTVNQAGGGGSTGTSSTCTGTCTLGSPGQPVPATGGPVTVAVTATSSWTVATPTDNWVHLTSPASNNGNSTVTFTVDANTGPPHSSTISIANQTFTIYQNGTPASTTPGCAYLVQSNTTQNIPNTGTTSGLIQVITAQNCAWTASTAATWITLKSGTSSTGNGAVAYTVPQNSTVNPRSGAILIAGQYVAINQAGGTVTPPPGTPVITAGGVVNTASYAPGGPPNGSLAQGSFFSIYGSTVGPDTPVQATTYPLPTTLGGVTVQVTQGSNKYNAPLVFVYKSQINAILPSNVPVGAAQITITYNSLTSQPADITVAKTSFGVFFQRVNGKDLAIAQNVKTATDYPLNLPDAPAKPAQIVIFWGTGLGPLAGADNTAPGAAGDMTTVPVTITVGGVAASRLYAGRQAETAAVDNVYFTIPAGVPLGCQVPVVVTAGGTAANTTNIAITADGSPCQ